MGRFKSRGRSKDFLASLGFVLRSTQPFLLLHSKPYHTFLLSIQGQTNLLCFKMVLYVHLIVYHLPKVPAHWALMVTEDKDEPVGTVFHATGSPFHGYHPEVKIKYNLRNTKRKYSRIFVGNIDESWSSQLANKARSLPGPAKSPAPLDPFAGDNCQDWAVDFVQLLIKDGVIDASSLAVLQTAPKV
ncbi:phosphotransferase family protein [Paramyrothecium foliicola]|nr:phosphotransferase family protein [Paramyrothecium foliicola]